MVRTATLGVRTETMDRIRTLAHDGEWKTVDELATVTRYPDLWFAELEDDGAFEVRDDVRLFRLKRRAS